MRKKRTVVANPDFPGTFHITNRCIRRNYLMDDGLPVKGRAKKRRQVVIDRLKALASAFAIDVLRVSIMTNHVHLQIRNRPDLVKRMSDEEVASRYFKIYPGYCQATVDAKNKKPTPPDQEDILKLAQDKKRIREIRRLLSSVSRFMQAFNFYTARYFNLVDGASGAFWQSRYKLKLLLDDLAILLCAFYIDLNPIRANSHLTLETSEYTSAYYQIRAAQILARSPATPLEMLPNAFLCPVTISNLEADQLTCQVSTRASDFGFTYMSSEEYLIALDLMGRIISQKHSGAIPAELPPIFTRLKLTWDAVLQLVQAYEELFCFFVGSKASLASKASELGCGPLKCPAATQGFVP